MQEGVYSKQKEQHVLKVKKKKKKERNKKINIQRRNMTKKNQKNKERTKRKGHFIKQKKRELFCLPPKRSG